MTKALVIARREVAEKKFVFLAAAVGAILPFLATLLPAVRNWSPQGMVSLSASILATGLALGLAIIGGASMIGRELAERRLSFYFARPVGAGSIWFGKLAAALFVLIVAPAIVLTPALLFAGDQWRTFGGTQWQVLGILGLVSLLLLCASHMVSSFVRSRSVLVILDFALAAAAGFAIPTMMRPLWNGMAMDSITVLSWGLVAAFVLAVIVGGAWQVADGRTDRKRSHAALSRGFWSVMGIALVAGALWVTWVVSAKPSAIAVQTDIVPAKEGNWVLLSGKARHRGDYVSGFAYDLGTGRYQRVSGIDLAWHNGTFTRDGKTALVRQRLSGRQTSQAELMVVPLANNGERQATGLITDWRTPFVPSDDAKRIAYVDHGILTVYDIPSKRSLLSMRIPVSEPLSMYFPSPDVLRIYSTDRQGPEYVVTIQELDVRTKALSSTGELRVQANGGFTMVSADGTKMLFRAFAKANAAAETLVLADARTGQRMMAVPRTDGERISGAALLADGSVFAPTVRNGNVTARIYGPAGALVREIPLGPGTHAYVAAELSGNRVVAGTAFENRQAGTTKTYVVDVAGGRVLRRADSLDLFSMGWDRDPRRGAPSAHQLLAAATKNAIVAWDPLTGETKEIAKRVAD
jgi:ABC-type transport system involved in multi-copper enzyme maturation permease subunit